MLSRGKIMIMEVKRDPDPPRLAKAIMVFKYTWPEVGHKTPLNMLKITAHAHDLFSSLQV